MIKKQAQAELNDVQKKNPLNLEVNFSDEYKDCVKVVFEKPRFNGNRVESIVKYSDLFSFMFMLANKEQQAKMMPVREEFGNEYMKQIHVRLKKDMKQGEEMVVNVPIKVSELLEAQVKNEMEKGKPTPYLTTKKEGV